LEAGTGAGTDAGGGLGLAGCPKPDLRRTVAKTIPATAAITAVAFLLSGMDFLITFME
jgi:hypothetical protein